MECSRALKGPRLSEAWQANRNTNTNRQDLIERGELQVNPETLTGEHAREEGQEHG